MGVLRTIKGTGEESGMELYYILIYFMSATAPMAPQTFPEYVPQHSHSSSSLNDHINYLLLLKYLFDNSFLIEKKRPYCMWKLRTFLVQFQSLALHFLVEIM